jgi:methionyl-tRNA formyltransferase
MSAKVRSLGSDTPGPNGDLGRILFMGSGAFAVPLLAAVAPLSSDILVITRPDRPAGRGLAQQSAPVAGWARHAGLQTVEPRRGRLGEAREEAARFAPDGLLLAAYGQLVPPDWLTLAERPPLNVHPSLLPRHRGADPVAGTILAGDTEGGVTLMIMVEALDAGPIVGQWRIPLTGRENAADLEAELADLAARVVPPLLAEWAVGHLEPVNQEDRQATLIRPFTRADGKIDWSRPAVEIDRQVRALQPWPGAWTTLEDRRLHVRRAHPGTGVGEVPVGLVVPGNPPEVACGGGSLVLDEVQPEGRGRMSGADWRRGIPRQHVLLGG